jgi:hypothetical protein
VCVSTLKRLLPLALSLDAESITESITADIITCPQNDMLSCSLERLKALYAVLRLRVQHANPSCNFRVFFFKR